MSKTNAKLDKMTALLSPEEKARYAVSAITDGLEAAMTGKGTAAPALSELEQIVSTIYPGSRQAFANEAYRLLCDFGLGMYLGEMQNALTWKIRCFDQAIRIQRLISGLFAEGMVPEGYEIPGDDFAPRLRKLITDLRDLREDALWSDIDATPPPLDEDIERMIADLAEPTA